MSFIYVYKKYDPIRKKDKIEIHSDTKINTTDCTFMNFSRAQLGVINQYGIVKSTIICPEICISYAGNNIFYASELFKRLSQKCCFERSDVIDIAYEIHMKAKSKDDIEFIITSYENDVLRIDCIKEREKELDCPFAWIGSYNTYRSFRQKCIEEDNTKARSIYNYFNDVINLTSDSSVGGFHMVAGFDYDSMSFQYIWNYQSIIERSHYVEAGESIRLYDDSANGGYTAETIPYSISNVIVEIKQVMLGILFSREFRMEASDIENDQLFGLMLPMLVKREDEQGAWKRYV